MNWNEAQINIVMMDKPNMSGLIDREVYTDSYQIYMKIIAPGLPNFKQGYASNWVYLSFLPLLKWCHINGFRYKVFFSDLLLWILTVKKMLIYVGKIIYRTWMETRNEKESLVRRHLNQGSFNCILVRVLKCQDDTDGSWISDSYEASVCIKNLNSQSTDNRRHEFKKSFVNHY